MSHAVRSPQAIASWRPSAGLSPVERYGRFEILGRIGRGGMAEILLARERSKAGSTRHLVIKRVLSDADDGAELVHMFLDEARVVMGLSHPNLCQIYEVGEQEGTWFIAMEWVNGTTLHQLIRRAQSEQDVDFAVLARIIAQCAEALHHAHTARDAEGRLLHLVHRDVSPHNIMLGYDGRVKLLDFGIAKSTKSTHRTEAGVVKGKVCYMAPEQWLSNPVDARTDVFALGTCLYEALSGRVVFRRETQSEVMRAVLKEGVPPLSETAPSVPPELAAIAHRALQFHPEDRFQSALEMSEALEDYLASRGASLAPSRIAAYVRRLFRTEVELGPMLERQVRGAHLSVAPALLPPLPPALLGLPKLTPSMLGLPEPDSMPDLELPDELSSVAEGTASRPCSAPPTRVDIGEAPRAAFADLEPEDLTQSTERPLSTPPSVDAPELALEAREAASQKIAPPSPEPRPLARTLSMYATERARRLFLLVAPAALVLLGVSYALLSHESHGDVALRTKPSAKVGAASAAARPAREPLHTSAASSAPLRKVSGAAARVGGVGPGDDLAESEAANAVAPELSQPGSDPVAETGGPEAEPARGARRGKMGKLSINTRPWSTVYLGHRVLGTTPLANVSVPRNALLLKLVDRDGHVHLRRVAPARRGDRSVFYDFAQRETQRAGK